MTLRLFMGIQKKWRSLCWVFSIQSWPEDKVVLFWRLSEVLCPILKQWRSWTGLFKEFGAFGPKAFLVQDCLDLAARTLKVFIVSAHCQINSIPRSRPLTFNRYRESTTIYGNWMSLVDRMKSLSKFPHSKRWIECNWNALWIKALLPLFL